MKMKKLQTIALAILLALFGAAVTEQKILANSPLNEDCEGLPAEVSTLLGEWHHAGIKTNCTVDRLMNWAVVHAPNKSDSGAITTEAMNLLNSIGYQNSPQIQSYGQATFDQWRKKENGVSAAFVNWKGESSATVIYLAEKKQYILVQYREFPKTESSSFSVKIEYGDGAPFSAEEKKQIEEAVGWWKDRINDKFEITLEFIKDPSIKAGGTTLVGNVPRSCIDHQPGYAEIKLKTVNTSLVSHEVGHALGIGTATIFKKSSICSRLAEASKDISEIEVRNVRMENGKFYGELSKGVLMVGDEDSYGHVSAEVKDEDGHASAVQPGLGGKPSLIDIRILEDLGYEIK
jgi:hypothetical protein